VPDIFDYLDYRKFLKNYHDDRKKNDPWFTHRYVAEKLSFNSGFYTKIIQGKRHISLKFAAPFAAFLNLGKRETEYFLTMVLFCKAKTHAEKNSFFEKLISFNRSKNHVLSQEQYAYFGTWYNPVIREVLAYYPFSGDYATLAKMVIPRITPAMAKKSIELLESLNLIKRHDDGVYGKVSPVWTTGEEARSMAIVNYQKAVMDLAKDAYDAFPKDERSMSTLTISVSAREYDEIRNDITALRQKILDAAQKCNAPDRVYQCNFFVFPVAKGLHKRGKK
jgi:uncharacterized protein (TIGR02147 family)